MKLDETQKRVACWSPDDGNLRVIGGAGAGKTGTLATLTAKLTMIDEIPPEDICVMAFNKDAGAELRTRIGALVGASVRDRMAVGTFHSLGRRWMDKMEPGRWDMRQCIDLPANGRGQGVPSGLMLWTKAVVYGSMPGTGVKSLEVSDSPGDYQRRVDLLRADCVSVADMPDDSDLRRFVDAWQMVEDAKAQLRLWDFADVLESWLKALRQRPEGWFKVVIVDEAQDNTRVRLEIARALAGTNGKIVLVGDLRQTIYVWAGAYPDLFRNADTELNAQTMCLGYNYRSTPDIVELSNRYAREKDWKLGDEASAFKSNEVPILPPTAYDTDMEMYEAWADEVLADHEVNPTNTRAVLLRTNGMIANCAAAFEMRNIPVVIRGSRPMLETREGKAAVDYVRAIWANDVEAFSRILNKPNRYASRALQDQIARQRLLEGEFVEDVMPRAIPRVRVAARTAKGLRAFAKQMKMWRAMGKWKDALENICGMCAACWHDSGEAHETDNVAVLYAAFRLAGRFKTPEAFLAFTDPARRPDPIHMNPVVLSTIHRAKGREWDVVFTDVTEGYMPFYRCAVSPSREEEERLLYVAMTRAQTTLHFGYFCEDDHPDIPCGLSQLCVPLWPDVESAPRRMTAEEEILDNCDYDFREW
jgi:DNA helicase-2/ATP-dependent DNA helicase PcrA